MIGWRRRQLRASGFPPPLAAEAAADERFDLHALIELTEQGCPPDARGPDPGTARARWDERAGVYSLRSRGSRPTDDAARATAAPPRLDPASREWLSSLRDEGQARDEAIERLHALLLRGARFEVGRRQASLPHLRGGELDDIALEAADDALMSVLRRLDDFRGLSRFTTWAYKFALYEAAVKLRRRAWQEREVPMEQDGWDLVSSAGLQPDQEAEQAELLAAIQQAIDARPLAPPAPRPRSPSPSTACRSTFSPSASARRAARSTRPCTTPGASCAGNSPATDTPSARHWRHRNDATCISHPSSNGCSARPQPRSAATPASTSSTATSTSSCGATTPMPRSPA